MIRREGRFAPDVLLLLLPLLLIMVPIGVFLLRTSLHASNADGSLGAFTWRYYADIFVGRDFAPALVNTVFYAGGAAVVATLLGGCQAWIAERTDSRLRGLLHLGAFISLGVPYTLNTIAWLLLLGRAGPANQLLSAVTGHATPMLNVYGLCGMIFIEGLTWAPLAFLMTGATLRNLDPSLEEAVLTAGGGLMIMLRRVILPLMTPTLLAVLLLSFTRGLESFEVPALVGSPARVRVLTTLIYDQVSRQMPPVYGRATAFAVFLVIVVGLLLWLYLRLLGTASRYRVVSGKSFRPRLIRLRRSGAILMGGLVLLSTSVTLLLPIGMLLWSALSPFTQSWSRSALRSLNLDHFRTVLVSGNALRVFANTLAMGLGTGLIATVLGAAIAWEVVRRRPGAKILDQVASIPMAFPAIVLGLAFLELFLAVPLPLYGTLTSLVIASSVAALPYAVRQTFTGLLQLHGDLEEAALVAGAGTLRVFWRVVLPLVAPSLVASFLFSFLLSVRAMAMLLLIAGPDSPIIAVTIYDMWSNGQPGELAALGLLWTAVMSVVTGGFFLLSLRFRIRVE